MVWDRLFGTWQREVAPVRYGLVAPLMCANPWHVHSYSLRRLIVELREARCLREALAALSSRPGDQHVHRREEPSARA